MSTQTKLTNDQNEPIRVLIVEDDALIAAEIESTLTEAGAVVVAVTRSADEALKRCEAYRPALALIDVELPGVRDGIELASELALRLGVRAIFVTGHSDPQSVLRAAPAKPLSWIKKPFGPGSIVAAVKLAMGQ